MGRMRGVLFNNLFFYTEDSSIFSNIPIHPNIAFNPLLLNQAIQENKFETLGAQTIDASLRFIYFSNVYSLMKMQYTHYLNNSTKALLDWSELFSFCDMSELLAKIEKLAR